MSNVDDCAFICFFLQCLMILSVAESIDALASSRTRIFLVCNSVLARQKPGLQFSPSSETASFFRIVTTKWSKMDSSRKMSAANLCFSVLFTLDIKIFWSCLDIPSKWHFLRTWKNIRSFWWEHDSSSLIYGGRFRFLLHRFPHCCDVVQDPDYSSWFPGSVGSRGIMLKVGLKW